MQELRINSAHMGIFCALLNARRNFILIANAINRANRVAAWVQRFKLAAQILDMAIDSPITDDSMIKIALRLQLGA